MCELVLSLPLALLVGAVYTAAVLWTGLMLGGTREANRIHALLGAEPNEFVSEMRKTLTPRGKHVD